MSQIKKGLIHIKERPNKHTIIYIFIPQNISSPTCKYSVESYYDLDYFNKRIDSGLCYYDEESVLNRIKNEYDRLLVTNLLGD